MAHYFSFLLGILTITLTLVLIIAVIECSVDILLGNVGSSSGSDTLTIDDHRRTVDWLGGILVGLDELFIFGSVKSANIGPVSVTANAGAGLTVSNNVADGVNVIGHVDVGNVDALGEHVCSQQHTELLLAEVLQGWLALGLTTSTVSVANERINVLNTPSLEVLHILLVEDFDAFAGLNEDDRSLAAVLLRGRLLMQPARESIEFLNREAEPSLLNADEILGCLPILVIMGMGELGFRSALTGATTSKVILELTATIRHSGSASFSASKKGRNEVFLVEVSISSTAQ
jgi:hypothetical protein